MEIAETVLKERYYQEGEDWAGLCRRVSHTVAQGEVGKGMEDVFFDCLYNKKFLPNSPTLMNAGLDGTLSACFTVEVNDNMDSIMDTVKDMAIIGKWGGGIGTNWSRIRPEGSQVGSTNGVASGPVSFLEMINTMADIVVQGGRRRIAIMSILDVDHADIKKFITVKSDRNKLKNMNMSVMIFDEFMEKVYNNDPEALDIWNLIIKQAHAEGEPGILFSSRINQDNFTPQIPIRESNPCVSADTVILTDKGYVRIDSVVDKTTKVWNGYEWSEVVPKVTGIDQDLMLIEFSDGSELKCTPYHKFILNDGTKVEAQDLYPGLKLTKYTFPIIDGTIKEDSKLMYTKGFYSGDGFFENSRNSPAIWLYGEKKNLIGRLCHLNSPNTYTDSRIYLRLDRNIDFNKEFVPDATYTIDSRLAWLAGIIDSDGCKNSTEGSVAISSTNKEFLFKIKYMLNTLGVNAHVNIMHLSNLRMMPDGHGGLKEYDCKDSYRLTISAFDVKTLIRIGLKLYRVKVNPTPNRNSGRFIAVRSIKLLDNKADKVYCFNEPLNHTGCFNGIVAGNCAEECMIPYSSCNLISIDLSKLVIDGKFEWQEFWDLIEVAIKFADSTIDVNKFPLEKIEEVTKGLRPIGLGVAGFAHCLIKLGIVYGSEESYEFADELFKFLHDSSISISRKLAMEYGPFPWLDQSTVTTPRRNCYVNSIAPTGTIATIMNTSFSIESVFTIAYERNVLNQTFNIFDPVFEEMIEAEGLDKDKIFNLVNKQPSIQHIEEIPEHIRKLFITAHDLTPEQHVRMVATIQKHIDTGVSKTVNVPENITIEEVDKIYRLAYELGCKGITIYRTGTRDAPIKLEEKPTKIETEYFAPDITFGPEQRVSVACGHFLCAVTGVDEQPLKIINNATTGCCDANLEALQRICSLALRSGISPSLVTKQLDKVVCNACTKNPKAEFKSCAAGISHVIKLYDKYYKAVGTINLDKPKTEEKEIKLEQEQSVIKEITCNSCKKQFIPNAKCSVCPHCGYSRCG